MIGYWIRMKYTTCIKWANEQMFPQFPSRKTRGFARVSGFCQRMGSNIARRGFGGDGNDEFVSTLYYADVAGGDEHHRANAVAPGQGGPLPGKVLLRSM